VGYNAVADNTGTCWLQNIQNLAKFRENLSL